jgi:hypothetical protein
VRNDASGVQIRKVRAHQVPEEIVQFFLGQRTNVVPFVMVVYYDEIVVRQVVVPMMKCASDRLILMALW